MSQFTQQAQRFFKGELLTFQDANALWKFLKKENELSLARQVLQRMRDKRESSLLAPLPSAAEVKSLLCREEAMLTSKDPELSAAMRHDLALQILQEEHDLTTLTDGETLGIAGGIYKRRWADLGQLEDLKEAVSFYERGATNEFGTDAYPHINAAFLNDLLASLGDDPERRSQKAHDLRQWIVNELVPMDDDWWNVASRAEALFGLRLYADATAVLQQASSKQDLWKLQTTAQQLATLAHLHTERPLDVPEIKKFFEILLPNAAAAVRSSFVGKVGLALSGGGFRASFFHLGVLARLAELNVLRHVDVLSCVSGGSIVGACYWLALRQRLLDPRPIGRAGYIKLVHDVIEHFQAAVATDIRRQIQPSVRRGLWRFWKKKGFLDPERAAQALESRFYRPLLKRDGPLYMHNLRLEPRDHDKPLTGSETFHPGRHNWLREHKVPVLVLNATTVNTGHAWQFTPGWMGESPWAIHEAADSVPRLEWSWYNPHAGWQIELGRAVAASACVPGVFSPLEIKDAYQDDVQVQLVDGGVHDNQGTVSLLALGCNLLLVSDAAGQLMLEKGALGLGSYAKRSMDTLMERIRLANYVDLSARQRAGLLRGLMFVHMKAGLDADTVRLRFSQESYESRRSILSPAGVRKDFQKALAELRTDLDLFTSIESYALMACGYQMASKAIQHDLAHLSELQETAIPPETPWPFEDILSELTSTDPETPRRQDLLEALRRGSKVQF